MMCCIVKKKNVTMMYDEKNNDVLPHMAGLKSPSKIKNHS
jgi:hypothetical protein